MDIRVAALNPVEGRAHRVPTADNELCAAFCRSTQGRLGIICRISRGGLAFRRVAVGIGKGLHALPQHGIRAAFRALGACGQHNFSAAHRDQRRVLRLVDKAGIIGGGRHSMLLLLTAGGLYALAGTQSSQQAQRQEQC